MLEILKMSSTNLIIEHLISGIQAMIWLLLCILCIFGFENIDFEKVKEYETILAFVMLSFTYPLGIFINNLSDKILQSKNQKIKKTYIKNPKLNVGYALDKATTILAEHFTYTRMRIRISRVTLDLLRCEMSIF